MHRLALLLLLGGASCQQTTTRSSDGAAVPASAKTTTAMTVFDFENDDTSTWDIQNDGVMGGDSKGTFSIEDGHLRFSGTTVTEGGGFSSVLAGGTLDLSGKAGVELRVRGDGREYEVAFHDGTRDRGREVWRRAPFATSDDWTTVRVPFSDLNTTAHGEPVDVGPLDKSAVGLFGFYIMDGEDGPFRLEVDYVKAY